MPADANRGEEPREPAGFGPVLQSYRLAAGVSQAELAERAGLSQRGISDLERGARRTPYLGTVRRLAQALNLDSDGLAALLTAARGQPHEAPSSPPPIARAALPLALTTFIGREQAVLEIQNLLGNTRLLTLTGPGGIGKTRLALEVVRGLGQQESTQGFVELQSVHDPALVPQTAATNLGIREDPQRGAVETLIDALGSRPLLLVLDNCEHVLAACATLAEELLRACPRLRILTTSRERLGIAGETLWRVAPLESADPRHLPPLDALARCPAVRLFVDRASAVDSGIVLTEFNARTVADICQKLDGIPLAIELAAARVNVLNLDQIAERLENRLRLLTSSSRTLPDRQLTLRATLEWSYDLLAEAERRLFERLAVFVGGWTLEAADVVCSGGCVPRDDVLDLLGRLIDKSLVVANDVGPVRRYGMLETIREYAHERLEDSGERDEVLNLRWRHAEYFAGLAERAGRRLLRADHAVWVVRLEQELDNTRAALGWCLDNPEPGVGLGVRIVAALTFFWELGAHLQEGRHWLRRLFEAAPAQLPERCLGLLSAGYLAWQAGDLATARASWQAGLQQARADNAVIYLPRLLIGAGAVLVWADRDLDGGRALLEEGLERARSQGDPWAVSQALFWLAEAAREQGDRARARTLLEESAVPLRQLGGGHLGRYLTCLGVFEHEAGNMEAAWRNYREALEIAREAQDDFVILMTLQAMAGVLAVTGQAGFAARLVGLVSSQRTRIGGAMEPTLGLAEHHRWTIDQLRRGLGEREFAAAEAVGRGMTPELAVLEVLTVDPTARRARRIRHPMRCE